jgi:hypothetical protein
LPSEKMLRSGGAPRSLQGPKPDADLLPTPGRSRFSVHVGRRRKIFESFHIAFATIAIIALALLTTAAEAQSISIQFDGSSFKVSGWKAPSAAPNRDWSTVFVVYAGSGDVPALAGNYAVENDTLVFRPTFPTAPGVHYRAVFHAPAGGATVEADFNGPPRNTKPTARVEHIYPSADVLPSNQLRIYICFTQPMSRGEAFTQIHVLDEDGKPLKGVFLPEEELWDPVYQRLTLTFDPGRIKRGLTSNMNIGPPIAEGKRYTLVIDRDWPDAQGVPMVEGYRKSYRGGPALRTPPDPRHWHIAQPMAGTAGALIVDFPTPMNYALLHRMLWVTGPHGKIPGTIVLAHDETEWRFTPASPWTAASYQLVTDTAIEDLAGNHIGQPFDIDVFQHVTQHIATNTISLPFTVR